MESAKADQRVEAPALKTTADLTTYMEGVGEVVSSKPDLNRQIIPTQNPYPETDIEAVLKRSYEVDNFSWPTSAGVHTLLKTLSFPHLLWNIPFINSKLSFFEYFRAGVRVTFRLNCTKFEYGTLLISWLPRYQSAGAGSNAFRMLDQSGGNNHCYYAAYCNPVLMSAQEGQTVTIEIPWLSPNPHMSVSSNLSEIGEVNVFVLHALNSVSASPPSAITVNVYAEFVNPQVIGFSPGAVPTTMAKYKKAIAEKNRSRRTVKERKEPDGKKEKKEHKEIPTETQGDVLKMGKNVRPEPSHSSQKVEAEEKSKTGILSGIAEGVSSIAPVVAPILGGIDPALGLIAEGVAPVANFLGGIFRSLGLNKPGSVAAPNYVYPRVDVGLAHGSGLDLVDKMSLDPEYAISTNGELVGDKIGQPPWKSILCKPSLFAIGEFNSANAVNSRIVSIPVWPSAAVAGAFSGGGHFYDVYAPTYMAYYSQMHRYWRGGIKIMLRFCTSSFVTCRVRVAHFLGVAPASWDPNESGDYVSEVLDITGDTTHTMMIPYLSQDYYCPCVRYDQVPGVAPNYTGFVGIYLETPVVSVDAGAAPPVYMSIWMAAAEDFVFHGYTGMGVNAVLLQPWSPVATEAAPKKAIKAAEVVDKPKKKFVDVNIPTETQCDVVGEFNKPFKGIAPAKYMPEMGVIRGENVDNLITNLHRYHAARAATTAVVTEKVLPELVLSQNPDAIEYMVAPFLFMRGGMRYFYKFGDTSWNGFIHPAPANQVNGVSVWSGDNSGHTYEVNSGVVYGGPPLMTPKAEMPYFDYRSFIEIFPTIDSTRVDYMTSQASEAGVLLRSVADDFSLGVLATPPPFYHQIS